MLFTTLSVAYKFFTCDPKVLHYKTQQQNSTMKIFTLQATVLESTVLSENRIMPYTHFFIS
jgi:hypothetical protein